MKTNLLLKLCLVVLLSSMFSLSYAKDESKPLMYYNALDFRLMNKAFGNTPTPYQRLPITLDDTLNVRKDLRDRQKCSSGIAIRFSTNSTKIGVKYDLIWDGGMNHMAKTGIKGMDLYCLNDEGVWEYVNAVRPKGKFEEYTLVSNMIPKMREFMFYLPLYDGVNEMWIGVDSTAVIKYPTLNNPRVDKKIVLYGTSITQGGCATRTGMAGSNIISREMNCEVANLGFSGEGRLDLFIAKELAKTHADLYLIDPIPNCTLDMIKERAVPFMRILHAARPNVPIVMVESPVYTYAKYDSFFGRYLPQKNKAYYDAYLQLKAEGMENLYYIDSEGIIGYDNEATVDGAHFTDFGYRRWADKIMPIIRPLLFPEQEKKSKK